MTEQEILQNIKTPKYILLTFMRLSMTKKQIAEYIILFVLGLIITIGFVNPVSKEYTWWNLIYQTKDLIQ